MTIANLFIDGPKVHLVTDAGIIGIGAKECMLLGISHKVVMLPEISAAFVVMGSMELPELLRGAIASSGLRDFDDLTVWLEQLVKNVGSGWLKDGRGYLGQNIILLAGYSARDQRPEGWTCIFNHRQSDPEITVGICAGAAEVLPPVRGIHFDRRDPIGSMRAIVEAQHNAREPMSARPQTVRPASGFATVTTIERDSITTRMLARWEDKVGDLVTAGAALTRRLCDEVVERVK